MARTPKHPSHLPRINTNRSNIAALTTRVDDLEAAGGGGGGSFSAGYRFSDSTAATDPGNERARLDNGVYASVTAAYLDDTARNPTFDMGALFQTINIGDRLFVQQDNDSTRSAIYVITGVTDNVGWWTFDLSYLDDGGGPMIANNANVSFGFIFEGNHKQHNDNATTDPGATDDADAGYEVGSVWINVTTDEAFMCLDATASAAVWKSLTDQGPLNNFSASTDPGVGDDSNDDYEVGSFWVNTTTDRAFQAMDVSVGAAVWKVITPEFLNNTTAIVDPVVGDDNLDGYARGSIWTNTVSEEAFMCLNPASGAAVWKVITPEILHNQDATTDPGAGDDSGDGYERGSHWINQTSDEAFICLDATAAAAVWKSVTDTGGAAVLPVFYFRADDMVSSNTANWAINGNAPMAVDSNDSSLRVRLSDDTLVEGFGTGEIHIPATATNMQVFTTARADVTPGGAVTAKGDAYFREILDGGAWNAVEELTDIDLGANENFVQDVTDQTIAAWGLTVDTTYELQIVRDSADGGDDLSGFLAWKSIRVEFT